MLKKSSKGVVDSNSSGGSGIAMLEDQLPSEQDRKATLGCVAAILNVTFASHQRVDIVSNNTLSNAGGSSSGSLKSKGNDDKILQDDTTQNSAHDNDMSNNFTIRDELDDDTANNKSFMSRSATQKQHQQQAIRRTKAFQKELLNISAELLFLSPDHAKVFLPNLDIECTDQSLEQELLLQPFLQSLSNSTESFRCIALLMFRFLLLSGEEKPKKQNDKKNGSVKEVGSELDKMTIVGYDARVRYAFKYLTVSILSYWEMKEHSEFMTYPSAVAYSTRKFEALEEGIALRLSILQQQMMDDKKKNGTSALSGQKKESTMKQNVIRGLKVGGAGVAAGTLFAITGGLAAPAIVGGIAAITGASSAVAVVATVLLLPAATTIFGVGGGTLVASKMSKRTAGLEEFDIVKISTDADDASKDEDSKNKESNKTITTPDLSRTVCISGWLRDKHDFQRPFGTTPSKLDDTHELFCRFCSVYQPDVIPECGNILKEWQGKEDELWEMCKASYGKDPSSLLPLKSGPRYDAKLIESEMKAVDDLIRIIGLPFPEQSADQSSMKPTQEQMDLPPTVNLLSDVLVSKTKEEGEELKKKINDTVLRSYKAWDFTAIYGSSELYVVEWESELLMELYGSSKEFQKDLAKKAAGEVAKKTALASLMVAVFVPSLILSLSNIIDEKWTLATERADEAGILLAQSLLNSTAGHRPVSLIGFSFGGRMIISCLKELARNQVIWERQREMKETNNDMAGSTLSKTASFRKSLSSMSIKQNEAKEIEFSREPASIVEDIVLMGTVASVNASTWTSCRGVVAGRIVNCYSTKDMILALMYRSKNLTTTVLNPPVGISSVKAPGVENYDVSHLVSGHGEYAVAVQEILQLVGYNQPMKTTV